MDDILNIRELRGIDIAHRYTIKLTDEGSWLVPSASGKGIKYKVDLGKQTCDCADFELRRDKCKHIFAAEFTYKQDIEKDCSIKQNYQAYELAIPRRKTYRQVWSAYDQAQRTEKSEFQYLLYDLCCGIGSPAQDSGRPRLSLEDMIFSCVYKVYSTFSLRRFNTDLEEAKRKGFILRVPHYKSMSRYFCDEMLTPYLQMMIEETSRPLVSIEKAFAVDASGLSTTTGFTWLHAKFTEPRLIDKKDWLKIHICCGTKTNIITAVEVTERHEHDTNYFKPLVEATSKHFEMNEVSADKAYLSKDNLQTAVDNNVIPYIAWKTNSKISETKNSHLWNKLYHYYSLYQDKFLEHYHKRSNIETTFSMIKKKFGDGLKSRMRTAQINEALCKILAHNICVLIQSMFELGIKPEFWK